MSEQELDNPEIPCSAVDQHRFRSPQRVRTELCRIKADASNPALGRAGRTDVSSTTRGSV
jgi:hypothetical protein